jgi:hypothetical protein
LYFFIQIKVFKKTFPKEKNPKRQKRKGNQENNLTTQTKTSSIVFTNNFIIIYKYNFFIMNYYIKKIQQNFLFFAGTGFEPVALGL